MWSPFGKQLVGRIVHRNSSYFLVSKESSIFSARRSTSFRIPNCALGRFSKTWVLQCMGTKIGMDEIFSKLQTLTESTVSQWNSSGIFFQGSVRCSSMKKSKKTAKIRRDNFTRTILFLSMFNDISCGTKDNETECLANAKLVSLYARRFGKRTMVIGLSSEKSGLLSVKTVHKESGTKLQKVCCWNSLRADAQFSVLRLHHPEVNSKAKDIVNCTFTLQQTRKRSRLFFA